MLEVVEKNKDYTNQSRKRNKPKAHYYFIDISQ